MRKSALALALFALVALVAGPARAQTNRLTSQPLEDLQEKGNAAIDFVQDENAEIAGAAFRLQSIVSLPNATVPQKLSLLADSTRSAFDAAVNRLRSLKLRPEQTAALYRDLLSQYKCVTTPAEWVAAFKANALVCASDDLVLRLSSGNTSSAALSNLLTRTSARAATFWSGADALAKYARTSFPQSLGDNIPQVNNPYFNQTYESANFAALRQFRNAQALINNVGYSVTEWSTTDTYLLGVFSKAAIRAAMRSDNEFKEKYNITSTTVGLQPFWQNAKAMYEVEFEAYNLRIPQVAIDIIANTTFADLTGCGAQCSFAQSFGAPNAACFPDLVYPGVRVNNDTCQPPSFGDKPDSYNAAACGNVPWAQTTGWTLVPPTAIDATQTPCSDNWMTYFNALKNAPKNAGLTKDEQGTLKSSIAVVQKYNELLAGIASTDAQQQAVLTRALFIQSAMGNFNSLNSGNGYTATGVGGIFMATSTELLMSPFNSTLIPPGKGFDSVSFCVNGVNGGKPSATGTCTQLTPAAP